MFVYKSNFFPSFSLIKFLHVFSLVASLCLVAVTGLVAQEASTTAEKPVKSARTRIANEATRLLSLCRETQYQHHTEIDEAKGFFKLDCSGFVSVVLKVVAPKVLALVATTNKSHPLAVDFYETISSASNFSEKTDTSTTAFKLGWSQVPLTQTQSGDILVWRKDEVLKGEATGHVMVVAKVPEKEADGIYKVRVIDSTSKPHGDDTRKEGQTGLGSGTLWLKTDEQGRCEGYCQSADKKHFHKTTILVGHVEESQEIK